MVDISSAMPAGAWFSKTCDVKSARECFLLSFCCCLRMIVQVCRVVLVRRIGWLELRVLHALYCTIMNLILRLRCCTSFSFRLIGLAMQL